VNTLHPASILAAWLALLVLVATVTGVHAMFLAASLTLIALVRAKSRYLQLLKRSRWLLLTLLLTFAFMTPGVYINAFFGATWDGLRLAAESVARLICTLASLAVVLEAVPSLRLVVGMRALLAPLEFASGLRGLRDRIAVRLILTLQAIESAHAPVIETDTLALPQIPFRAADSLVGCLAAGLLVASVMRSMA
jgi:energy-coupling factor transport system permease protein